MSASEWSKNFVDELAEQGEEFCVIGLTGKVRSGTADVCNLLTNPDFHTHMDLPAVNKDIPVDAREYRIIYRYLREHWKPFVEVSVPSVIISYLLDLNSEEIVALRNSEKIIEILNSSIQDENNFKRAVLKKIQAVDLVLNCGKGTYEQETWDKTYKNLFGNLSSEGGLFRYWKQVKQVLESDNSKPEVNLDLAYLFCFGVLPALEERIRDELKEDDQYTILFQSFGNNIRATGKAIAPTAHTVCAKELFSLPARVNQFIKVLRNRPMNKFDTKENALNKQGKKPVFVVINNFKNIFEAYYFKRRYAAFYLMAVSCDEQSRQARFKNQDNFVLANLREDLSSGKKLFKAVKEAKQFNPELLKDNTQKEKMLTAVEDELGLNHAEKVFINDIFSTEDTLRQDAYNQNFAPFVLQDVVTCVENADAFVTRDQEEVESRYDHQLIRQLGRIVTLILHPGLLTPTKVERCMQIAMTAKLNSGCLSRQVGAVVTDRDYNILSLGWNDTPCGVESCLRRNFFDMARKSDETAYSRYELNDKAFRKYVDVVNQALEPQKLHGLPMAFCFKDIYQDLIHQRDQIYTRALHGEERALASCGNERAAGGYLFTTSSPCELCAKRAKEAKISKIYYIQQYPGISHTHVNDVGDGETWAEYESFVGAVGLAYIKLYTPLIPYKDELAALDFSPVDVYKNVTTLDSDDTKTNMEANEKDSFTKDLDSSKQAQSDQQRQSRQQPI